jgi:hypothetical protein
VGLIAAIALLAAGCGGTSTVPDGPVNLDKLRASDIPVFYMGTSFSGLELSFADIPAGKRALLTYGTCQASGGTCSPPLEIQTCLGSETVSFLGKRALAERASAALKPLNPAARKLGKPRVKINRGLSCT